MPGEPKEPNQNEENKIEELLKTSPDKVVWERLTDEDILRLRSELYVNEAPGAEKLVSAPLKIGEDFVENLRPVIEKSGVDRLIDLGGSHSINSSNSMNSEALRISSLGINEYVCVDLAVEDTEVNWKPNPKLIENFGTIYPGYNESGLHVKKQKQEILTALHALPDNYGHVSMTGIEKVNIVQNYGSWGIALLAEIKRVVPENGIFYTDDGFMDDILRRLVPDFSSAWAAFKAGEGSQIEKLKCPKNDDFKLGKYVLDAPEIGFRIYFPREYKEYSAYAPIILINTDKVKLEKAE